MQNLLNNRWLIVALTIAAVLMLARSLTHSLFSTPEFDDSADVYDWLENTEPVSSAINSGTVPQTTSTGNIFWNANPGRDPFSRYKTYATKDTRAIQHQAKVKSGDIRGRQPILSALVSGQISKYAIVDGKIVTEGDSVGKFRIIAIVNDGVWLQHKDQRIKLSLARQAE